MVSPLLASGTSSAAGAEPAVASPPCAGAMIGSRAAGGSARGAPLGAEPQRPRGDQRWPHHAPCCLRVMDGQSGVALTLHGRTVNVSSQGLAVQINQSLVEGGWVEALVTHGDGQVLRIAGTIAHCRRVLSTVYEVGIRRDAPPEE